MDLTDRVRDFALNVDAIRGGFLEKRMYKVYQPIFYLDSEFGYPIMGMKQGAPGAWESSALQGVFKLVIDKERVKYWKLLGITSTKVALASATLLAAYVAVSPTYFLTEPVKIERAVTIGRQILGKFFGYF